MIFRRLFKKERRKGLRVPIRVKIFLNVVSDEESRIESDSVEGEIKNISMKGACVLLSTMTIEGRHLFMSNDAGLEHRLVLSLPEGEGEGSFPVPIEMKWYRDAEGERLPFEAGVQFKDLPNDVRQKLRQFLKKHNR